MLETSRQPKSCWLTTWGKSSRGHCNAGVRRCQGSHRNVAPFEGLKVWNDFHFENLSSKHSNDHKTNQKPLLKSQDEALTKDRRMVRVWSSKCADASPQDPVCVGRNFFQTWGERALFASDAGAGALGFVIKKPTMEVFWIWFDQAMLRCRWKISQLSAKSYCRQFRLLGFHETLSKRWFPSTFVRSSKKKDLVLMSRWKREWTFVCIQVERYERTESAETHLGALAKS